uniref:Uncharacterized protein n=1 Tax=Oryza brachyantha TaxID=4533 RepID=J3KUW7_ORYBR
MKQKSCTCMSIRMLCQHTQINRSHTPLHKEAGKRKLSMAPFTNDKQKLADSILVAAF